MRFDPASVGAKVDTLLLTLDSGLSGDPSPVVFLAGDGTGALGVGPGAGRPGLRLLGPNPVTDQTGFACAVTRSSRVTPGLDDIAGRNVRMLFDGVGAVGAHTGSGSPRMILLR